MGADGSVEVLAVGKADFGSDDSYEGVGLDQQGVGARHAAILDIDFQTHAELAPEEHELRP